MRVRVCVCVLLPACARAPVYEYPEGISATCTCSQQQTHVCEFHVCLTMLLAWLCLMSVAAYPTRVFPF